MGTRKGVLCYSYTRCTRTTYPVLFYIVFINISFFSHRQTWSIERNVFPIILGRRCGNIDAKCGHSKMATTGILEQFFSWWRKQSRQQRFLSYCTGRTGEWADYQ